MYQYNAVCTRVIDGDTVEVVVDVGFNIKHTIRGRLYNVDAPELFSGNNKDNARKVKEYLDELVLNKTVVVNTYKDRMSFNRWIIEIHSLNGQSINEQVSTFCQQLSTSLV